MPREAVIFVSEFLPLSTNQLLEFSVLPNNWIASLKGMSRQCTQAILHFPR